MMKQVPEQEIVSTSVDDTLNIGRRLAASLHGGDTVLLRGELGAGKTVLARGLAQGLGFSHFRGSPTFTLVNEYDGPKPMYHLDLYRLNEVDVADLGLEDYLSPDSVLVIEWPERARGYLAGLGRRHWVVDLQHDGEERRRVRIHPPAVSA